MHTEFGVQALLGIVLEVLMGCPYLWLLSLHETAVGPRHMLRAAQVILTLIEAHEPLTASV